MPLIGDPSKSASYLARLCGHVNAAYIHFCFKGPIARKKKVINVQVGKSEEQLCCNLQDIVC